MTLHSPRPDRPAAGHARSVRAWALALLALSAILAPDGRADAQAVIIGGDRTVPSGASVIINQDVLDRLRQSRSTASGVSAPARRAILGRAPFTPPLPPRRPDAAPDRPVEQVAAIPSPDGAVSVPTAPLPRERPTAATATPAGTAIAAPAPLRDPRNPERPTIPARPELTIAPPPLPAAPTTVETATVPEPRTLAASVLPAVPDIVAARPPQPTERTLPPPVVPTSPPPPAVTAGEVGATPDQVVALPGGDGFRIFFPVGEARITEDAGRLLNGIAQRMLEEDALRIRLRTYASILPEESASDARRLSLFRALAIRSLLSDRGIDVRRLEVLALGDPADGTPPDRADLQFLS